MKRDLTKVHHTRKTQSLNSAELLNDETTKNAILQEVMEERMKREETILSTSPHKKIVNAIRYAKAINSSLDSNLEKTLSLLHREFEQEFRRILDVQQEAFKEFPVLFRSYFSVFSGITNKQFQRRLSEALEKRKRYEDFRRTRTKLSLPTVSSAASRENSSKEILSQWKTDSDIVYLPPI